MKNTEYQSRLLIIRFSSFGDIVQALSAPASFKKQFPQSRIDWLVRHDFAGLLIQQPNIDRVLSFDRLSGLRSLALLAWNLGAENYTHVYDAHCNLRSRVVTTLMRLRQLSIQLSKPFGRKPQMRFCTRSKNRWKRLLYFRFHAATLPRPFRGSESFLWPLQKAGWLPASLEPLGPTFVSTNRLPAAVEAQLTLGNEARIALAPSAAWSMKRWPVEHWKKLILLLAASETPPIEFILLGGPDDHFLKEIEATLPGQVRNLAGQVSLRENADVLNRVDVLVSGDTGLLHLGDQMEVPTIALIGPTAFGYPSHPTSQVLEIELACKPCSKDGRGGCRNSIYQRCLVELTPERVAGAVQNTLQNRHKKHEPKHGRE